MPRETIVIALGGNSLLPPWSRFLLPGNQGAVVGRTISRLAHAGLPWRPGPAA